MFTPMHPGRPGSGLPTFEDLMASFALIDESFAEDDDGEPLYAGIVDAPRADTCAQPKQPSSAHSSGDSAGPESSVLKRHAWDTVVEAREADAEKMARLRQRNRDAQARHRKRQRERAVYLATRAQELQQRLASAQSKKQELQELKASHSQRLCVASAKLSVTKDIVRTLPLAKPVGAAPQPGTQALIRAQSPRLHQQAAPHVPRPLTTFHHFIPLAVEHILEGDDSIHTGSAVRVITERFKAQQAERTGCPPEDICWFLQMHFEVSPGVRLSLSSTLSSTACISSYALNYFATSLQMALFASLDRTVPDVMEPVNILTGADDMMPSCPHKRTREAFGVSECRLAPSRASAAAAAAACSDFRPAAHPLSRLPLSCGVNRCCAVDLGVLNVIRNVSAKFCGVVPEDTIASICASLLDQVTSMLQMFEQTTEGATGGGDDTGFKDEGAGEQGTRFFEDLTNGACAVLMACKQALDHVLRHLPGMVAAATAVLQQDTSDEGTRVIALGSQMRHCALTMTMLDSRMFTEAGPFMCRMAMVSHTPLLSFCAMESLNAATYKQLQLTTVQKERFWEFWAAWERRKRALDSTMQAARSLLRMLPDSINLPTGFINHINALAVASSDLQHVASGRRGGRAASSRRFGAGPHATSAVLDDDWRAEPLLGMSHEDTDTAARCVRDLRAAHEADVETFMDFKEVQLLVFAVLDARQMTCIWAAHVQAKAAPADFMGLCQLATSQMQREALFRLCTYS